MENSEAVVTLGYRRLRMRLGTKGYLRLPGMGSREGLKGALGEDGVKVYFSRTNPKIL